MSEHEAILEKVQIKNFLSLHNVTLPLKPLTVLVGPNASGKSNCLETLRFFNWMQKGSQSKINSIKGFFNSGETNRLTYQIHEQSVKPNSEFKLLFSVEDNAIHYELTLDIESDNPVIIERLLINNILVIKVENGNGIIFDEYGTNPTVLNSNKPVLASTEFCNNPITSVITNFIKHWKFYDFQPDSIKLYFDNYGIPKTDLFEELDLVSSLSDYGSALTELFSSWFESDPERFRNVNESLVSSLKLRIDRCKINGNYRFCILEKNMRPVSLLRASEGTLRLVAYYILLNLPDLPPLIAIEEPERSLHPGALKDIAAVLKQLSERTQVIITTHSSHLLDAFNPDNISDSLGVLLLRNRPGLGTEVINLEDIRDNREGLDGWISDFGIGSAIFDSQLLQDLMEESV